jgi:hypothetical protein
MPNLEKEDTILADLLPINLLKGKDLSNKADKNDVKAEVNCSITVISGSETDNCDKNIDKYLKPKQSANTLFHFMSELDHLEKMIKKQKIMPRYCTEDFSFLNSRLPKLAFPMKCFCDIYLNKLVTHMTLYGHYGIGFDKKWLIEKGVQPIQYINEKSELSDSLSKQFLSYFEKTNGDIPADLFEEPFFKSLRYIKARSASAIDGNIYLSCILEDTMKIAVLRKSAVTNGDELCLDLI